MKVIHIDMDCFYAAIEMRDNPTLQDKPIAVGGASDRRGVLCTCNYIARQYGVRSAMATAHALKLCPELILVPVDIPKYKAVSQEIFKIFDNYTHLMEALSLDEAYLDVTHSPLHDNQATLIAEEIRTRIFDEQQLTASAGVAPNKLIAKIASDINKPNGITVIKPHHVERFIKTVKIEQIFGIGKVTAKKMHQLNLSTCADLQCLSIEELVNHFGKFGIALYDYCRGIDHRNVNPDRQRKSVSVEHTYIEDLNSLEACLEQLPALIADLEQRLARLDSPSINKQFVKVKRYNFQQNTMETRSIALNNNVYYDLLKQTYQRFNEPVRLLGIGVGLAEESYQRPLPLTMSCS
jgi:DNA polymerase-4